MIEAIELTSTRRSRGPGAGRVADVSFDVYPGQVTALLGAPGTGKSAVLRMMVELEPAGGRTLFGGRPFHALRPAVREVGLALNPDALHPRRTVQAHLQLYSAAGGVPRGRVAEVLEIAGMSTQAAVRCGRLDAGQRQRLALAAALLGDPAALILDEPRALDAQGRSWFHALIRAYAAQGRTVLVAATDPDSLAGTADHVVVLRRDEEDGISRVAASRSAAEVFDERRATVVQVRSPQAARLAAALETQGARLVPAGPGVLQVRGLDRARIGELAHVAGVCLHELSEVGQDDDVFGLRPLPRQKELLPGLKRVDTRDAGAGTTWSSGVRLVSGESSARETATAEPAGAPTHAPVAGWHGRSGVPEQGADADQEAKPAGGGLPAGAADAPETLADHSRAAVAASPAHADRPQDAVETVQALTHRSQGAAEPGQTPADRPQAATAADQTPGRQLPVAAEGGARADRPQAPAEASGTSIGPSRVAAEAGGGHADESQPAAEASQTPTQQSYAAEAGRAQAAVAASQAHIGQWRAVVYAGQPQAEQRQAEQPQATAKTDQPQADRSRAAVEVRRSPVLEPIAGTSQTIAPTLRAPSQPSTPKRATNRAFATFRRRGKGEAPDHQPQVTIAAASSPSPPQPAVPFTVSPSPAVEPGADAEGMTPWRAVAARAVRDHQGSVVEAAPAEQEASA